MNHPIGPRMGRRALRGLFAGCFFCIAGSGSSQDLEHCIEKPQPQDFVPSQSIGAVEERGNLTLMELSGDYTRGVTQPRQDVAHAFYTAHPDRYDFLITFTTFEFETQEAIAFYNSIANDVSGIGAPIFNYAAQFGSASGKLQGYLDMAALSRYSFDGASPGYRFLLDTAAHELMHRWVASVRYRKSDGSTSADLLGRDGAHWSYFLDTDASVMYGSDWRDRGDGSFEAIDTRHRYSPLDLYLSGFASASEVPDFGLIRGGQGSPIDYPLQGAITPGTRETIGVGQIVAAEGPRIPDVSTAPKEFRAALILLHRPGESVPADDVVALEHFRSRLQQRFAQMTNGRAILRIATDANGTATAGLPEILHGSGAATAPGGAVAAVAWLESQQATDGHWEDRPATAVRDTSAVYTALRRLHPDFSGLATANSWLAARSVATLDQRAARFASAASDTDLPALLAAREPGKGWGLLAGWTSTPFDSAVTTEAMVVAGRSADIPAEAIQYLAGSQYPDGGFGFAERGSARILATLRGASALNGVGSTYADARTRAANWIAARQNADGSFGDGGSSSITDTAEVFAAGSRIALTAGAVEGARLYLASSQQHAGDWNGSVYATALAAVASSQDAQPNLAIAGSLRISSASPRDGDHVIVSATVINDGHASVAATSAQWYVGDPSAGGTPIGAPIFVPSLSGHEQSTVEQSWDTTGLAGMRALWLALDVGGVVAESSEDDNFGHLDVTIAPPPSQPDLMVDASEISVDPTTIASFPATVHVRGSVHDVGTIAVMGAVVRLVAVSPTGEPTLAEMTLDVPARGSALFDFSFDATASGPLRVAVVADPDNQIAEAAEDNNRAEVGISTQSSIDLAVTDADIVFGSSAVVGHDQPIHLLLHNLGTVDAPTATLHVEIAQGDFHTVVFDGATQIGAGTTIARDLSWRPSTIGPATLTADIDPANLVAESNESNNHASKTFTVSLSGNADLAIADDSLSFSPSPALEGSPMTASLRVRNLGDTPAAAFSVALFARDPSLGGLPLAHTSIDQLGAGADVLVSIDVPATPGSGDEHFYAMVDADAQVAEADETNNTAVQLLRVLALPDVAITVSDVTLTPSLPVPGESVHATIHVNNVGGQTAQGVAVHLFEGLDDRGAEIPSTQQVGSLAAGASLELNWSWILGADSRAVTAKATSQGGATDANPFNDVATLPFDVQDGNFFTSERYISPDGDGARDSAVVVFRLPLTAVGVYVDVSNAVPRIVRKFETVSTRDDGRVQVLWDGRDDAQRIVPDGDYTIVAHDADGHDLGSVTVTVDLNRSSPLEAVHTPYEVMAKLPSNVKTWQRVPAGAGFGSRVVGVGDATGTSDPYGLFRSDILLPGAEPVVTPRWVAAYLSAHGGSGLRGISAVGTSPDGATLVFTLPTTNGSGATSAVFSTRVDQTDTVRQLAASVPMDAFATPHVRFFDATEALVWSDGDAPTAVNLASGATRPFSLQGGGTILAITSEGVVMGSSNLKPRRFLPRSGANAGTFIADDNQEDDDHLSPDGRWVASHRIRDGRETVVLVRTADGTRSEIHGIDVYTLSYEFTSNTISRLQAAWLEREGEIVVGDASTQRIFRFNENGEPLGSSPMAPINREGDYVVDFTSYTGKRALTGENAAIDVEPGKIYTTQAFRDPAGIQTVCHDPSVWSRATTQHQFYDPVGDRLYFGTTEVVSVLSTYSGVQLLSLAGIVDYQSSASGAAAAQRVSASTYLPLASPLDQLTYPRIDSCEQSIPAAWPMYMLADGGRVRADRQVETLSAGVKPGVWAYAQDIVDAWPDDTHLAIGDPTGTLPFDRVFSSLLNEPTILRLTSLGRGIQLFGNATDRNFASYQIDWTDADAPGVWHVLTPPSHEPVRLDEFLTWVPPQPGNFLVRLTIVDLAGNRSTATASVGSQDSAPIEALQVEPRFVSPNGDGVKDEAIAQFLVRVPVSLGIDIVSESGTTVRHVSQTYGSAELGAHEFRWNGRDDSGNLVPDGRYHFEVEGFGVWLTVDSHDPQLLSQVTPVVVRAQPRQPKSIGAEVSYQAADLNLDSLTLEYATRGGSDWSSAASADIFPEDLLPPEQASGKSVSTKRIGLALYAGHDLRMVATDKAGNRHVEFAGPSVDVLLPYAFSNVGSDDQPPSGSALAPIVEFYSQEDIGNDGNGSREIIVGAGGTSHLFVGDATGGIDQLIVETQLRDAGHATPSPDAWEVRAQVPAVYHCPAFACIEGADGHVFDAPLAMESVPPQTALWVRVRGLRGNTSSVSSIAIPILVVGIEAPAPFLGSGPFGCLVRAREFVPGRMSDAHITVSTSTGAAKVLDSVSSNDGALFFVVPDFADGTTLGSGIVDAIGTDGRLYHSPPGEVAVSCGVNVPPGNGGAGGAADQISFEVAVIGHEHCEATPTNRIGLRGEVSHAGSASPIRVSYRATSSGDWTTLFETGTDAQALQLDTSGLPEGTITARLEADYGSGFVQVGTKSVPIVHTPPIAQLDSPATGTRVCPVRGADNLLVLMTEGRVSGANGVGYKIETERASAPGIVRCAFIDGFVKGQIADGCIDLDQPYVPDRHNFVGPLGRIAPPASTDPSDALTVRVKAVNWSGATVCSASTVEFDTGVELIERHTPAPRLSSQPPGWLALSGAGSPDFATARVLLKAEEQLEIHVRVVTTTLQENTYVPDGGTLVELLDDTDVIGDVDVSWDGRGAGGVGLPDGVYAIVVDAQDHCGNARRLTYFVELDSTPPDIAITRPAAGDLVQPAVVAVSGHVSDAHVGSWTLSIDAGDPPLRQGISDGDHAVAEGGSLGTFSRNGASGPAVLHMVALDQLGNQSGIDVPITLGTPAVLIGSAMLQPDLFSPNGDGHNDTTRIALVLLQSVHADVDILGASNVVVRSLWLDHPLGAGSQALPWDGRANGGGALPDGIYSARIVVRDAQGQGNTETVELPVELDTLAPVLAIPVPAGTFAGTGSTVEISVDDRNLDHYSANLLRTSDAQTVASVEGSQPGLVQVADLSGIPEGTYTARVTATDRAGNSSQANKDFVLDRTPPDVSIAAPAEGGVLAGAARSSIHGHATDAHFAHFQLDVAPAAGENWTPVSTGDSPISAGELAVWTPSQPDGTYRLRLRASDAAGNTAESIIHFDIDSTPPLATISAPVDNAYVTRALEVLGSATDLHFANYSLAIATPPQAAAGQWSDLVRASTPVDVAILAHVDVGQPDGDYVVRLRVVDAVGLASTAQTQIHLDTQPPPAPTTLVAQVENHRDSVLQWTPVVASDLAGYSVYRDGARINATLVAPASYRDPDVSEGPHTYFVRAVDRAGNESASSNDASVVIDHTPPATALLVPSPAARIGGNVDVIGTAFSRDDFKEYRLSVIPVSPAGPVQDVRRSPVSQQNQLLGTWNTHGFAEDGHVRVHLEAEDLRGNIGIAEVDVVVDNAPPAAPTGLVVVLAGLDANAQWNPNTESDLLGYLLYRDGVLVNASGGTGVDLRAFAIVETNYPDVHVPDGGHTYVVRAIDQAANISPPSSAFLLPAVENGPPHLQFLQPQDGASFEHSIVAIATSADQDIATVQFAYRRSGDATWVPIGAAQTAPPYRVQWAPVALPYAAYELQAVATDLGGHVDPAPPVVHVTYADLTPPDAPLHLGARAVGAGVHLQWDASVATDTAGYILWRSGMNGVFQALNPAPLIATSFDDPGRPPGDVTYFVSARDTYGNDSPPGVQATAHVFAVLLDQPYSPTTAASIELDGSSIRQGAVHVHVDDSAGAHDMDLDPVGADAVIHVDAWPILVGTTRITATVTDAEGNISIPGEIWMDRGDAPSAPTGVVAAVAGHHVSLQWNANPEPDVVGYRVFLDGQAVAADASGGFSMTAHSDNCCSAAGNAVDGNSATAWQGVWYATRVGDEGPSLVVDFDAVHDVASVQLWWSGLASPIDLYAWSGHAWIRIVHRDYPSWDTQQLTPEAPYRTQRLKFVLLAATTGFNNVQLAEVTPYERPLLAATSDVADLIDGHHSYRVTAVDALAFESAPSEPAIADVGDVIAPEPVVLSGNVDGVFTHLSWTPSASPDTALYAVYRDGDYVAEVQAGDALSFTDGELAASTYAYTVRAYDAFDNESDASNEVVLTVTDVLLLPPTVSVAAPATGGALRIHWTESNELVPISFVIVRRSLAESGPYEDITYIYDGSTWYLDAPLQDGTRYWYVVEAHDDADLASGPSEPASGTPLDVSVPQPPVLSFPTIAEIPLVMRGAQVGVCGLSEPGAEIALFRNGTSVIAAHASVSPTDTVVPIGGSHGTVAPSPDGTRLFVGSFAGATLVSTMDGSSAGSLVTTDNLAAWNAVGDILYTAPSYGTQITRRDLATGHQDVVVQPVVSLRQFVVSPDGARFAMIGSVWDAEGASVYGLWVFDAGTSSLRRVDGVDPGEIDLHSLSMAADGAHIAFNAGGGAVIVDFATLERTDVSFATSANIPAWSPDGTRLAVTRSFEGNSQIWIYDLDTATLTSVFDVGQSINAFAWRPDGDGFVVLYYGGYSLATYAMTSDGYVQDGSFYPGASGSAVSWTMAGRIVVSGGGMTAYTLVPAGWFCSEPLPLAAGSNEIDAIATDQVGHSGLTSLPIELDRPAAGLADLGIAAADILFVPAAGRIGEAFGAVATVRNRGGAVAPATSVRFDFSSPAGVIVHPQPTTALHALAPGESQSLSVSFGPLSDAGAYRLAVFVDPSGSVDDADRSNNNAAASLQVSATGAPTIAAGITHAIYAPGESVAGGVDVSNPGVAFSGSVRLAILDASGMQAADLGNYAVQALGFGAAWHRDVSWLPDVFAGVYELRAELRDLTGQLVSSARAPFTIQEQRTIDLRLVPDRLVVGGLQSVSFATDLSFLSGNAPLSGAQMIWRVKDALGAQVWSTSMSLGTLLPGYAVHRDVIWPGASVAGTYHAEVELTADGVGQIAGADLLVQDTPPSAAIAGTISFAPGTPFVAGHLMEVAYDVGNVGSIGVAAAQLRLRVLGAPGVLAIAQRIDTVDLAVQQHAQQSLALTMPPITFGSYAAVLDAHLPGEADGTWRPLAQAGFAVVDGIPPEITLLAPASSSVQPALVPISAYVVDHESSVASVAFSIDGGGLQSLSLRADGTWGSSLAGLSDGTHRVAIRAVDAWGNLAQSTDVVFDVDAIAPSIDIQAVFDGERVNHTVSPSILVADTHLASVDVFLNGDAYVSGTSIDAEGEYVLDVRAADLAGNRSTRTLRFAIDRTAPPVAIISPLDGATVTEGNVAVDVTSEPAATISVASGGYSASAVVANDGHAHFDAVPLIQGDNLVQATAVDAADNASAPASVTVHYNPSQVGALSASLQPTTNPVAAGSLLQVDLHATNPNAVPLATQTLRVRVLSALQQVLAEQSVSRPFAANEIYSTELDFPTGGWTLGTLTLTLELQSGTGYSLVDTKTVDLVDRTPPTLSAIAPLASVVVRSPVVIHASAIDALSDVSSVEARIDGGDWIAMTEAPAPEYASTPQVLGEGPHAYVLRATDTPGNVASADEIVFIIDTIAPQIVISGVDDGGLVAHPLTPLIDVLDAHPGTIDVRLNGLPFDSGTTLDASGDYTLAVHAVDAAGNSSDASILFTIDLDPPVVVFTAPQDGAIAAQPHVDVTGTTEAMSGVHVRVGTFTADVLAAADGTFSVADVPLVAGSNTIVANAVDPAGNIGADSQVTVTYQASSMPTVEGHLQALVAQVSQGDPLLVPYQLVNPGDVPINAQPIRIELRNPSSGLIVSSQAFTVDLAAQEIQDAQAMLDTHSASPGSYDVRLEALLPADPEPVWSLLDSTPIVVVVPNCTGDPVERIFIDGFERFIRDLIFCNGFETEISPDKRTAGVTFPQKWIANASRWSPAGPFQVMRAPVMPPRISTHEGRRIPMRAAARGEGQQPLAWEFPEMIDERLSPNAFRASAMDGDAG